MKPSTEPRSEYVLHALSNCPHCAGSGLAGLKKKNHCRCVRRGIFRAVLSYVNYLTAYPRLVHPMRLDGVSKRVYRPAVIGLDQDYLADFYLLAKRTLDPLKFAIFRYYHLFGASQKLCCDRLGMDRGTFYNAVYSIEEAIGRAMVTLQPPLYPTSR